MCHRPEELRKFIGAAYFAPVIDHSEGGPTMSKGQKSITGLLAAIAVLLGLNLIVRGSPSAHGQAIGGQPEPTVVNGVAYTDSGSYRHIWRFWSDGRVDFTMADIICNDMEISCGPDDVLPPYCVGDIDRNGDVAIGDLLSLLAAWGPCLMFSLLAM
jgi:hypothetical protein